MSTRESGTSRPAVSRPGAPGAAAAAARGSWCKSIRPAPCTTTSGWKPTGCRDGWEGRIAKRADAPYQGGRSRDWLKFKCENAQEFVIGGYTDPQRSRVGFGALLLGYHNRDGDLVYAGKVGTGFDTQTLRSLHDRLARLRRSQPPFRHGRLPPRRGVHWVQPRLVGQIAFTEWTGDGQLRHPRFQGLRDDKDPADVVREVPS